MCIGIKSKKTLKAAWTLLLEYSEGEVVGDLTFEDVKGLTPFSVVLHASGVWEVSTEEHFSLRLEYSEKPDKLGLKLYAMDERY